MYLSYSVSAANIVNKGVYYSESGEANETHWRFYVTKSESSGELCAKSSMSIYETPYQRYGNFSVARMNYRDNSIDEFDENDAYYSGGLYSLHNGVKRIYSSRYYYHHTVYTKPSIQNNFYIDIIVKNYK